MTLDCREGIFYAIVKQISIILDEVSQTQKDNVYLKFRLAENHQEPHPTFSNKSVF